ncbi:LysR family transcriptional regulator [Paenibacillus sp. LMG 31456]|uniref:LysR family transcriptional regulator n=1 Tax=Paenibacillus foliorum TaxID=2654974 RepID=A0A972GKN7_9BACL|nr:LysR family transcriptional regulator [Paenibacillus foliorum]
MQFIPFSYVRSSDMDIHQLQCVIEIVHCGSFTKAAATLHITRPTIS